VDEMAGKFFFGEAPQPRIALRSMRATLAAMGASESSFLALSEMLMTYCFAFRGSPTQCFTVSDSHVSTDDQSIARVPDRMPLDEVRKAVIDVSLEDLFKPSSRRITGLARKWVILENGFLAHFAGHVDECREFAQFLQQCDLRIFDGRPEFPSSLRRSIYTKQLEAIVQACILQPNGRYEHKLATLNGRQHSPVEGCSCTEIGAGAKFISPAIIKSLSETLMDRNIGSRSACLGAMGMLMQFERLSPHEFISSGVGGGIEGVVPTLDGKHDGEWQPVGDTLFLFGNIFNLRGVKLLRIIPVVIIQKYTESGTLYYRLA
jgi:hypothetical protein